MSDTHAPSVFSLDALPQRIAHTALPHWRELTGASLTPVKIRENAVFRAVCPNDDTYALRLHRSGYHSDKSLLSEFTWMQALRDAGINTPRVIQSKAGRYFETVIDQGIRYQVDVFEWIDGHGFGLPLGQADIPLPVVTQQYRLMGAAMGSAHNQAARWTPPETFQRHAWDRRGLVGEQPLWGRFWELDQLTDEQRHLMLEVRDTLDCALAELDAGSDHFGMIHADFMPDNVIVKNNELYLIDFDDSGFGWYLFDMATALFAFSMRPYFSDVCAALIEGYRSQREMTAATLERLPMFLAARGTTLLGWLHSRQQAEASQRAPILIELACHAARQWLSRTNG